MKKLICVLLLIVVLATLFVACGKFTCDLCGEEKTGKRYTEEVWGEEVTYCDDCYQALKSFVG